MKLKLNDFGELESTEGKGNIQIIDERGIYFEDEKIFSNQSIAVTKVEEENKGEGQNKEKMETPEKISDECSVDKVHAPSGMYISRIIKKIMLIVDIKTIKEKFKL